eukprot:TRINITY_DN10539_c0_g1_i1.p2 TRINITY_DN10539_c0_g1~~TRINITY_DN10539_c0_g1_i1.p2  ORF type:complete len:140 (+),score=38.10 TRINITY_DN10539_c0_g1_i1:77-496(+)
MKLGGGLSGFGGLNKQHESREDIAKKLKRDLFTKQTLEKIEKALEFCDDDEQKAVLYLMQTDDEDVCDDAERKKNAFAMSHAIFSQTTRTGLQRIVLTDSEDDDDEDDDEPANLRTELQPQQSFSGIKSSMKMMTNRQT